MRQSPREQVERAIQRGTGLALQTRRIQFSRRVGRQALSPVQPGLDSHIGPVGRRRRNEPSMGFFDLTGLQIDSLRRISEPTIEPH